MKRLCTLLLALVLLSPAALADVLIEPRDDFYESHTEECEYLFRRYTANGEEGYVTLFESPKSSRERENMANGEVFASGWRYADTWLAVFGEGGEDIRGWVKLADCVPVPDYISFQEAHEAEFVPYDAGTYDRAFDDLESVVLWSYPGAGQEGINEADGAWFQNGDNGPGDFSETCWEDDQGRMWGFVSYCYGIRNTWVCLSDPGNRELEANPEVIPQEGPSYPAATTLPPPTSGVSGLTVGLVVLVVAATAVLIPVLTRRKKEG